MPAIRRSLYRCLFTVLLAGGSMAVSFAQTATEYQVKAAFLFNFTHFVEWPAQGFPSAQSPMVIGILGKDPFGRILQQIITGE
jgi:hypothetical protein